MCVMNNSGPCPVTTKQTIFAAGYLKPFCWIKNMQSVCKVAY